MDYEFTGYDEEGNPTHVRTDNGFMETSRPFVPEEDGWMLDQLTYDMFPAIHTGDQMVSLVNEVNDLRREVFRLKKLLDMHENAI